MFRVAGRSSRDQVNNNSAGLSKKESNLWKRALKRLQKGFFASKKEEKAPKQEPESIADAKWFIRNSCQAPNNDIATLKPGKPKLRSRVMVRPATTSVTPCREYIHDTRQLHGARSLKILCPSSSDRSIQAQAEVEVNEHPIPFPPISKESFSKGLPQSLPLAENTETATRSQLEELPESTSIVRTESQFNELSETSSLVEIECKELPRSLPATIRTESQSKDLPRPLPPGRHLRKLRVKSGKTTPRSVRATPSSFVLENSDHDEFARALSRRLRRESQVREELVLAPAYIPTHAASDFLKVVAPGNRLDYTRENRPAAYGKGRNGVPIHDSDRFESTVDEASRDFQVSLNKCNPERLADDRDWCNPRISSLVVVNAPNPRAAKVMDKVIANHCPRGVSNTSRRLMSRRPTSMAGGIIEKIGDYIKPTPAPAYRYRRKTFSEDNGPESYNVTDELSPTLAGKQVEYQAALMNPPEPRKRWSNLNSKNPYKDIVERIESTPPVRMDDGLWGGWKSTGANARPGVRRIRCNNEGSTEGWNVRRSLEQRALSQENPLTR